ncbi:ankyrin repeat domain-containing protein [Streptosporangium amethystogenes subsp. fukuiense]|uniref:Ankyrin repeat domain-containing protein n=1 Tax=Streptosporangium amethystogenes subsp. fukuiense TaxID=698418 RepID=A0ABW2SXX7_9ACTN
MSDNEWAEDVDAWRDTNLARIRRRLASGFDPGQWLPWLRTTPLHRAAQEGAVQVMELLLASGAEVDPVDADGATPLWEAVRHGWDDAVRVLLAAGADPWRPCIAGRSPGSQALFTELADLFDQLPGAPTVSPRLRELQDTVDAMMFSYEDYNEGLCVAFVGEVTEDEVIRRLGAAPESCPPLSTGELWSAERASPVEVLRVASPPGGGVVLFQSDGILPVHDGVGRAVTSGGGVLAGAFPFASASVDIWRDGLPAGRPSVHEQLSDSSMVELWMCRFGDCGAHPSTATERTLGLMTLLTSTYITEEWLWSAPMRLVPVTLRRNG